MLENFLFLADAVHHVHDDVLVLAAQFAQFDKLLRNPRMTSFQRGGNIRNQRPNACLRCRADDVMFGGEQLAC